MKKLTEFADYLEAKLSKEFNYDIDELALKQIVKDYDFSDTNWRDYEEDPGDKPYGRKLVYQSENIEIILMTWGIDRVCDIHDHGASLGVVKILEGHLINTVYNVDTASGMPEETVEELAEEDVILEVPKDLYHRMKNKLTDRHSFTLHVYTPPITKMKVFDLDKKLLITVADDCGAWVSEPRAHLQIEKIN